MKIDTPEHIETPGPAHLDVIKIDDFWGQIVAIANTEYTVNRLADNTLLHINPEQLKLVKTYRLYQKASDIVADSSSGFTQQMFKNLRWGPEQEENPTKWKGEVNVFGEYESIS